MSNPISLVRQMDRENAAKAKRDAAKAARAAGGKTTRRRRRRKAGTKSVASACKYKVRGGGRKTVKCFTKVKSATSAAKSLVRKGAASASVSGPVGKRKKKIKVLKVCRKPKSGGKVRCETKHKNRRRKGTRRAALPPVEMRSPGPWADTYVFGS